MGKDALYLFYYDRILSYYVKTIRYNIQVILEFIS